MKRLGIVKAVVSGNYEDVSQWKKDAPDKVIAGVLNGPPEKVDLNFLRNEYKAGRLQVIGEVAQQYVGIAPNDPRMEPLFALAEELDIPIGLHMYPGGPPGQPYMRGSSLRASLGDPFLLEDVLVRHPKLRVYVMHAGWPFLDHMLALMYAYPNVYVDLGVISWSQPRTESHRYLRALVEGGYSKRIMFGSDQGVWPEALGMAVDAVKSAEFLTAQQRSDILYHNAACFFRLEPTPRFAPPGAMETLPRNYQWPFCLSPVRPGDMGYTTLRAWIHGSSTSSPSSPGPALSSPPSMTVKFNLGPTKTTKTFPHQRPLLPSLRRTVVNGIVLP